MYVRPVDPTGISSWYAHTRRNPPSQEAGVDYYCPVGTPILAAGDGRVVAVGGGIEPATGRFLTIDLNDGRRVRYLHLSRWLKSAGDPVRQGAVVAYSGASGYGSETAAGGPGTGGPHVHTTLWPSHAYSFGPNAGTLDFEEYVGASGAGGGSTPFDPPVRLEDEMISIHAPNRGIAVIGPGYYKSLTPEEAENVVAITTKQISGNDRQFDLWRNMALGGEHTGS
jgi:murein DD-endopeptidase MepM/ murein hydrolase activator NlpD